MVADARQACAPAKILIPVTHSRLPYGAATEVTLGRALALTRADVKLSGKRNV